MKNKILIILLAVFIFLIGSLCILFKTGWIQTKAKQFAIDLMEKNINGDIEIESIGGNFIAGILINDVRITPSDEPQPLITVEKIKVQYNLLDLIRGKLKIKSIDIDSPIIEIEKYADGKFNFQKLIPIKETPPTPQEPRRKKLSLSIKKLSIEDGRITSKGIPYIEEISDMNFRTSIKIFENKIDFRLLNGWMNIGDFKVKRISAHTSVDEGQIDVKNFLLLSERSKIKFSGKFSKKNIELNTSNRIDLSEIKYFLNKDVRGSLSIEAEARGSLDKINGKGEIVIKKGGFEKYELGGLKLVFLALESRINYELVRWTLGGGSIRSSGMVDLQKKPAVVSARVLLSKLNLSKIGLGERFESDIGGEITLAGRFGSQKDFRGKLKLDIKESSISGVPVDELHSSISFTPEVTHLEKFSLRSRRATILADGEIYRDAINIGIETNEIEISDFASLSGVKDLGGKLYLNLLVQGTPKNPFVIGTFRVRDGGVKQAHFKNLSGNISYQTLKGLPSIDFKLKLVDIKIAKKKVDSFELKIESKKKKFFYTVNASAPRQSFDMEGYASVSQKKTDLKITSILLDSHKQKLENDGDICITITPEKISLEKSKLGFKKGTISTWGSFSREDKSLSFSLDIQNIDLRRAVLFAELKKLVKGNFNLDLAVSGSLHQPEFNLGIKIEGFCFEYTDLESVELAFAYKDRVLDISKIQIEQEGSVSTITGYIPIDLGIESEDRFPKRDMEIDAIFNNVGIWLFYTIKPYADFKKGRIDANFRATGWVKKPTVNGELTVHFGEFFARPIGTTISNLETYVTFDENGIYIQSFSAKTEEGYVKLTGEVVLKEAEIQNLDIDVTIEKLPARVEGVDALINSKVKIGGKPENLRIDVDVDIVRCEVTSIPVSQSGGSSTEGASPSKISCNISVKSDNTIRVKLPVVNIGDVDMLVGGEMGIKIKESGTFFTGDMGVMKGSVSYLGSWFDIVKGELSFRNSPIPDPELDILAETKVSYIGGAEGGEEQPIEKTVTIWLEVKGTLMSPKPGLYSDDPSLDLKDLAAILTAGIGWDEIVSAERSEFLREAMLGKAEDFAMGQITRSVGRTVGLDALRLKTDILGGEKEAKLTAGKYVSKDLYVSGTKDLFSTKYEFKAEWFVLKKGSVFVKRDENSRYNLKLRFKIRF